MRKQRWWLFDFVILGVATIPVVALCQQPSAAPRNIAPQATVWASSEFSGAYHARFATDGVIPELFSRDDAGRAWAVDGAHYGGRARFVLEWPEPVTVAEIIYYGRVAWLTEECWKDYEVRLDDAPEPVARGRFEMNAGPQRIKIKPTRARRVILDFLSDYGGPNPGAAEIEVYSESPPDEALPKLARLPTNLAPRAHVSASSEYSPAYAGTHAVDGQIAEPFSAADAGNAWAVDGASWGGQASFTLQWDEPVRISEIVYHGRTAFLVEECFKDYEVYLDDEPTPVAKGTFGEGSGAQPIALEPRVARKVTLRFCGSYGGPNPGAAEIQVFDVPPPPGYLPPFKPGGWDRPEESPELTAAVREKRLGFDALVLVERHELNPSHVYTVHCEGFRPGGGLYILSPPTPDGTLRQLVASPQGQILDFDVSYDAKEIVFSWRRTAAEGYHIYRINVDGTGLTQLTDGPWHDYNACWLPDGGIAFVSTRAQVFALCFVTPAGVLYRMDRDGRDVRRISGNYINDFTPSVLPDGRILFSRWEYVDRPAIPIQSLWTINPDGTGMAVFYGNRVLSPASFLEARAVPNRPYVICTMTAHNGPIRGAIGLIDRSHGVNAQEAIRNLTPWIDIGRVDQGDGNFVKGPFENPYPIDENRFLVSAKGNIYIGDFEGRWAVVFPRGKSLGYYCPQPLRPRPRPPVIPPQSPSEATDRPATVYLSDVYIGLEPYVRRGEITHIAVIEEVAKPLRTEVMGFGFQRPVISCGATYAVKRVIGYAPVADDGSAAFQVPPNIPVYFEALDSHGQALQRMRSFVSFAPGEVRGCIGCHEPRNFAPKTHHPSTVTQPIQPLSPPEWGDAPFDYSKIVQPVLDRHCAGCHSGVNPAGGVDLSGGKTEWFNVSYDVLTRGYVSWIDTRNGQEANILQIAPRTWGSPASKLAALILSGHPDATGQPRVHLNDPEKRRILTWIDLNVPYYSTYEMAYPQAEGGRRLRPEGLDELLRDVWQRRCSSCHPSGLPSCGFVRITDPELNDFLVAPLAKEAGGRQSCGQPIFATKEDPDYQALLRLFDPLKKMLQERPRMDMPGAKPAPANRSCL